MNIYSIINLSDYESLAKLEYHHKYFFCAILTTVYNGSGEFYLRQSQGKWHASYTKGEASVEFVDPLDFEIDGMMKYINSICYKSVGNEKIPYFDGYSCFKIIDEIVIALFLFDGDEEGDWISMRLLYGDRAITEAYAVFNVYFDNKII